MFLNNRYQDPTVGVFLSVDPLVSKTGTPYLYAAGNPTTLSDPNGLEPGCGATAAKAGRGVCAAEHKTADLLGTAAQIRHSDDLSASPINSWFQTCVFAYNGCLDGNVDRWGGFGWRSELGKEIAANFELAMWLLGVLVGAGFATVDGSGALVGPEGGFFAPTASVTAGGSLIVTPNEVRGGDLFEGCGWTCFLVTGITGILATATAGAACAGGTVATGGMGAPAICTGAATVGIAFTGLAYEASSHRGMDGGDVVCALFFGPSDPAPAVITAAVSVGTSASLEGGRAAAKEFSQEVGLQVLQTMSDVC